MVIFVKTHKICKSGFLVSVNLGSVTQPYHRNKCTNLNHWTIYLIMKRGPGVVVLRFFKKQWPETIKSIILSFKKWRQFEGVISIDKRMDFFWKMDKRNFLSICQKSASLYQCITKNQDILAKLIHIVEFPNKSIKFWF